LGCEVTFCFSVLLLLVLGFDTGATLLGVASNSPHWKRGEVVRFQHVDTGKYLSSNKQKFPNPIPGQQEVCAIGQLTKDTDWSAEEGFYFPKNS